MSDKLNIGDVVLLKGDTDDVRMTVADVTVNDLYVTCVWLDREHKAQQCAFKVAVLRKLRS